MTSMKMSTRPTSLLVVCGLLALWGLLSFYKSAVLGKITLHSLHLDCGVLALVAAPLLLMKTRAGHWMSVVLTYYWLIGSVLWALQVFPLPGVTITSHSGIPDVLPLMWQRLLVGPFLALQIWQLWVLKRPGIRALFYGQPTAAAGTSGSGDAASSPVPEPNH